MRKVKVYLFLSETPVMKTFRQSIDLFSVVDFVQSPDEAEVVVSVALSDLEGLYDQDKWFVLLNVKQQEIQSKDRLVVLDVVKALAGFMGLIAKIADEK